MLESLLFENGYQAVVLYRLASWFKRHRVPVLGPLVARLSLFLTGVDVSPTAEIGPGLMISHGIGIVVGYRVRIGEGATLLHQVTLGAATTRQRAAMPVLGDGIYVGAGAKLIGEIEVGDGCFIGADVLLTESVPPGTKVTAVKELRREG